MLLDSLPAESTLKEMLDRNQITEGFNDFIFEAMKCLALDIDDWAKYVVLSWDAINLKPELHYVRQGDEEGYLLGVDRESKHLATQANVLMLKSIFGNFKLPLLYEFHDPSLTATKIKKTIEKAITKVNGTGLIVKALVCDQGPAHIGLFSNTFQVSPEKPYIVRDNQKIFCLFDPPHLLKSIKSNLKKAVGVQKRKDGTEALANWADIVSFYELDCQKITRVAPKLTESHIFGDSMTNMNVPMAAQVLSRTVAGGIRQCIQDGKIDKKAEGTAELCTFFNDLFDSCNAKIRRPDPEKPEEWLPRRKPLKEAVTADSPHHVLWSKATEYIKNLRFYRPPKGEQEDGTFYRPPCLNGWLLTIAAFQGLWDEMHALGCEEMPTGAINQDFVENFFSQVRYRNGHPDVTPREFCRVYKFLMVQHVMDPTRGKNSNCLEDGAVFWDLFNQVDFTKIAAQKSQSAVNDRDKQEGETSKDPEDTEEYVLSDNHGDVKYASYLARRLTQNNGMCDFCLTAFAVDPGSREEQHSILSLTEDKSSNYSFVACSSRLQLFVHRASKSFIQILQISYAEKDIGALLAEAIKCSEDFDFLESSCALHGEVNKTFMVKVMLRSLMRFVLKQQNHQLKAVLRASRGKVKIATLATSAKVPKLFSDEVIFSKRVSVARPLIGGQSSTSYPQVTTNIYQAAAEENKAAWKKKGNLKNSAGLFAQFTPAGKKLEVSEEVEIREEGISVLDSTLPSPQHHSTPLAQRTKRKSECESSQVNTDKRIRPRAQSFTSPLLTRPLMIMARPGGQQTATPMRPRTNSLNGVFGQPLCFIRMPSATDPIPANPQTPRTIMVRLQPSTKFILPEPSATKQENPR
ncbi:uncharacterized protein LOC132196089 [Neocloeon triangulifer]|uniref:uncharacterized protein LOC132196089 n=1 Tax=Neocloeon triangulifer TaxID=2078957 RepID=UPI00286ED90C|nr:uncharacterized protein LOC132196089 [Neocloeon triangulifer]